MIFDKIKNKVVKINKIKFFGTSCLRGRGFTLIELVVAMGIMAMVIFFTGTVFKTSIGSYRIAAAQAEIMQKFRAITDQLNNDFRGLRKDAPLFIWFQLDPNDNNKRLDQIMFFADGDFQSIQTYDVNSGYIIPQPSGSPVVSNLARIYYGHAQSLDPNKNNYNNLNDPYNIQPYNRVLSRRQHLSIANPDPPQTRYAEFPLNSGGVLTLNPINNDWFEHDTNSLSQWQAAVQNSTNVNTIITNCFGVAPFYSDYRPTVNLTKANTLHLLMTEKVGSFSVQWSYLHNDVVMDQNDIYWWPSIDPDGNDLFTYSDFDASYMNLNAFGFYFNTTDPPAPANSYWFPYSRASGYYYPDPASLINPGIKPAFPRALKFTFTLYDSRGVFKDGQTFTHIIYLGD